MQSLTASYNSPFNDIGVGGSKEDSSPNHSIRRKPLRPSIGKSANSLSGATAISVRRCVNRVRYA
jgi:hypothetical protein